MFTFFTELSAEVLLTELKLEVEKEESTLSHKRGLNNLSAVSLQVCPKLVQLIAQECSHLSGDALTNN